MQKKINADNTIKFGTTIQSNLYKLKKLLSFGKKRIFHVSHHT
jgi:hypothetical protein